LITFLVRCRLRDDDAKQVEAEGIIADVVALTERDEPDSVSYNFYRSANDSRELILVESYVSNEAFLKHNTSANMVRFRERFADFVRRGDEPCRTAGADGGVQPFVVGDRGAGWILRVKSVS